MFGDAPLLHTLHHCWPESRQPTPATAQVAFPSQPLRLGLPPVRQTLPVSIIWTTYARLRGPRLTQSTGPPGQPQSATARPVSRARTSRGRRSCFPDSVVRFRLADSGPGKTC
jgi:hypothetical protein